MTVIVGRVFLLLILEVLLRGGNCKLFDNWDWNDIHRVIQAACPLQCSGEPCIENCIRRRQINELGEGARADARLICRDVDVVVLARNPGLFVIYRTDEYGVSNSENLRLSHVFVTNTTEEMAFQRGVRSFQFDLYRLSADGISMPEITEWMDTLPRGYHPKHVTNITTRTFHAGFDETLGLWTVEISFTPSEDRPCHYEVRCQQDDGPYDQMITLTKVEDFSVTFERLPFAINFTVTIKSLTDKLRWGNLNDVRGTIATFSTPRCWPPQNNSRLYCVPGAVVGLNATATHKTGKIFDVQVRWDGPVDGQYFDNYYIDIYPVGGRGKDRVSKAVEWVDWILIFPFGTALFMNDGVYLLVPAAVEGLNATAMPKVDNTFDIHILWDWPEIIPDFYIVNLTLNGTQTDRSVFKNISGSVNETVFSDVEISEEFNVTVRAWSSARGGPEVTQRFIKLQILNGRTDVPEDIRMAIYLTGSTLFMVIGIGIAAYRYHRLRKRRRNKDTPVDEFEMNPDRLTITRVLGTGAFGVVKFGTLRDDEGNITYVAVKMLQDDLNEKDRRNFLHEINIMKTIDEHPNIVCLLGCSTGPYPFLVVEYCSRGDLQSFLRKSLEEASTLVESETMKRIVPTFRSPKRKEILKANSKILSIFRNRDNYVQPGSCTDEQDTNFESEVVTVMEMLNFGRQIATGMEFLSSSRVVHRDLAARNILVCCNRTVKISDFGLSRDIYKENIYKKSGNGREPLKWMAVEALTHQLYTTCSDVWSFGVLLWEIMTRGGEPYPGVPTLQILNQLQSGYRMERPANCSIPLYNVMLSCWKLRPRERPTFTILRQELDKLIHAATKKEYFDLNEVSEETTPEDEDSQITSSHRSSNSLQAVIADDLELPIITEVPEETMDEPEMS